MVQGFAFTHIKPLFNFQSVDYSDGFFRHNEDATGPPRMPSVTDKDYKPQERNGSPTVAEKDILVSFFKNKHHNFLNYVIVRKII